MSELNDPIQIEDLGFIRVKIGEVEQELDLWEVNNRLLAIHEAHQGKPAHEQNAAVVELIISLGFQKISHMAAHKFAISIADRVGQVLKKSGLSSEESVESHDTTASALSV